MPKNIITVYVIVIAASAAFSAYLLFFPSSVGLFFSERAWDVALTFTMLTVLAGGSGLLVQSIIRNNDKKEETRKAHYEKISLVRDEFTEAYNCIKKCRRTIRSSSVFKAEDAYTARAVLDAEMNFLQDAHLRIEKIRRISVGDKVILGLQKSELLIELMSTIDNNLREILAEYEASYDKRRDVDAAGLVPLGFWVRQFIMPTGYDGTIYNLLLLPCKKVFEILWSVKS